MAPRSRAEGLAARVTAERRLFGPSVQAYCENRERREESERSEGCLIDGGKERGKEGRKEGLTSGDGGRRSHLLYNESQTQAWVSEPYFEECGEQDRGSAGLTAPTTTTGFPQLTVASMKKAVSSSVSVPCVMTCLKHILSALLAIPSLQ